MKEVLRTSSLSQAESLAIALEAAGIPALVSNRNLAGLPPTMCTVAVTDDNDHDSAVTILRELDQAFADPVSRLPSQRLLFAVLTVLIAILVTLCLQL
jgi:putative signal transducing protein